jgi:hypothetical protein
MNGHSATARRPPTIGLLRLLALAGGLTVANIYYNHFLL